MEGDPTPVSDEQWRKTRWAYRDKMPVTEYENRLWVHLKDGQLGTEFTQNHPHKHVHAFLDFWSHDLQLAIEVDGEVHMHGSNIQKDIVRTQQLEGHGVYVLRFTNQQVVSQIEYVVGHIRKVIEWRKLELKGSGSSQSVTGAAGAG